jgi:hypothetical protein
MLVAHLPARAPLLAPVPRPPVLAPVEGEFGQPRYQANAENPASCRWPELKARISTAGYDPGAA